MVFDKLLSDFYMNILAQCSTRFLTLDSYFISQGIPLLPCIYRYQRQDRLGRLVLSHQNVSTRQHEIWNANIFVENSIKANIIIHLWDSNTSNYNWINKTIRNHSKIGERIARKSLTIENRCISVISLDLTLRNFDER